MATCEYCGCDVSPKAKYCENCGAPLPAVPVEQTEPPSYTPVSYPGQAQQYSFSQPVPPVSTGGLLAWSIVTLLLCLIPGIIALVKTVNINKAATVEEQQARMSSAKTWCIIGTVLGILSIIGALATN